MNILQKIILDNWPGLEERYRFSVPCQGLKPGKPCNNRFPIDYLQHRHEDLEKTKVTCQSCFAQQDVESLLFGFEKDDGRKEQAILQKEITELKITLENFPDRLAYNTMTIMRAIATESKDGPKLFTIEPADGNWRRLKAKHYRLRLWCEAEGCQHPVYEEGKGVYEFVATRDWFKKVAPYANFIAGVLRTVLPAAANAANSFFSEDIMKQKEIIDHLEIIQEATAELMAEDFNNPDKSRDRHSSLSASERSGVLKLHKLLREKDPNHEKLGLRRTPTPTGDFIWLCETHYKKFHSDIPDKFE